MDKTKLSQIKNFMNRQIDALKYIDEVLTYADPETDLADITAFVTTQRNACNTVLAIIDKIEPTVPVAAAPKEPAVKSKKPEKPKAMPLVDDTLDLFGQMDESSEDNPEDDPEETDNEGEGDDE